VTPSRRQLINGFIATWLVWQTTLPLTYYIGRDPDNERFSWRMFSHTWMLQKTCTVRAREYLRRLGSDHDVGSRVIDLDRSLNSTWVRHLRQNHGRVTMKFLRMRCEMDPDVIAVRVARTCQGAPTSSTSTTARQHTCPPTTVEK
jgi:hypothetical protein